MYITPDILLGHLQTCWNISTIGRAAADRDLPLPSFFYHNQTPEADQLYVARSSDLPRNCPCRCLFICIGNYPSQLPMSWKGSVFYIENGPSDILTLFNQVQKFFNQIDQWSFRMQSLLIKKAPVEEFVKASIPLFNNGIIITDYALQILVNYYGTLSEDDKPVIRRDERHERVPSQISSTFAEQFLSSTSLRTPFRFKGQEADPNGNNYCINLFQGDTYIGCCTMYDCVHPMSETDCRLFQIFAKFIGQALEQAAGSPDSQIVTVKSLFLDLLRSFPVSAEEKDMAMNLLKHNMDMVNRTFDHWACIVIRSANRDKVLPEQYLCRTIEEMLPHTAAVCYEESIALLCMIPVGDSVEDTVCDILKPYLADMNFRAAVSVPFRDIYDARTYYLQARSILSIGMRSDPSVCLYFFEDYALRYLLDHASGEFSPELLMTPGLRELRDNSMAIDYWGTLRCFLNNECNTSETAREMFLHRSTLISRLDHIRSWVDLDDPDARIYLRIMTRLLT